MGMSNPVIGLDWGKFVDAGVAFTLCHNTSALIEVATMTADEVPGASVVGRVYNAQEGVTREVVRAGYGYVRLVSSPEGITSIKAILYSD